MSDTLWQPATWPSDDVPASPANRGARRAAGSPATPTAVAAKGLHKSYWQGRQEVPVLRGIELAVPQGSLTAIVGQSGCGKSTLLHLLGTLDQPDRGEVWLGARRVDNLPGRQRDVVRNRYVGMVFQFYHLLPELTALENVLVPRMIALGAWPYWRQRRENVERAKWLLQLVGLSHRLRHRPRQLSGGEMQRVAIARALVAHPRILLADEPTGNLDRSSGQEVLRTLVELCRQEQVTVVMVTHDENIARQADRVVRLVEGRTE
jgi:lipoprotein-releasing system ATP-binding protein